jgi:nucleotide-binding universal stress UspA family protein
MNRILIPLDGSEFSGQIIDAVRKFFGPEACSLVLYRVGATQEGYTGLPPRPATPSVPVEMYESGADVEMARHPIYSSQESDSRTSALSDELEPLAQHLRSAGYTVNTEAELGHPAEAIIERARAQDVDLIAMTTHGRSGLSRLLFGSVAEQIVRHTAVPVLLLRPTANPDDEYIAHA